MNQSQQSLNGKGKRLLEGYGGVEMVTDTSLQSYFEHKDSGKMGNQEKIVYDYIKSHHGCSRNQIEKGTNIRINAVCGRVNQLIRKKLVGVIGIRNDPITKRKVEILGVSEVFEVFGGGSL